MMKQTTTTTTPILPLVILITSLFITMISWTSCDKGIIPESIVPENCEGFEIGCSKLVSAPAIIARQQHQATLVTDTNDLTGSQYKVMVIGSHSLPTFCYTSGVVIPDSAIQYRSDINLKTYQYQTLTSYPKNNTFAANALLIGGQESTTKETPSNIILHYDAQNEQLTRSLQNLLEARAAHTATYLYSSKQVFITGGTDILSSELYSPNTQSITSVATLPNPRYHHTATYFMDANDDEYVFLFGGSSTVENIANDNLSPLEYNVGSDIFAKKTNKQTRIQHTATWLSNRFYQNLLPIAQLKLEERNTSQRILIAGGKNADNTTLATAQFYDTNTGFFESIDQKLQTPRHSHTATLIPNTDGKVLLIGGHDGSSSLTTIEVYDPEKNNFQFFDCQLSHARHGHSATYIPRNKEIFIFGGFNEGNFVKETEFLRLDKLDCW